MKAKLEWVDGDLMLGPWTLARIYPSSHFSWLGEIVAVGDWPVDNEEWQDRADAMQDFEREARRLLREAGVEP